MLRDNYITVYNIYRDSEGENEHFNRTIFYVHLEESRGELENGTSEKNSSTHSIFIPFSVQSEVSKTYVEPEEYEKLEDRSQVFTFQKGDIVVKGAVEEDITSEKEFIMAHPQALRIRSCDMHNFGSMALRHWEVHCD